ncbi:MAG: hypothetical protein DRI44_05885 [Chlamydiae bacterium]|nr:MAG: hypothetical protein DRI44_05885 [Chlamydiota bacterium]
MKTKLFKKMFILLSAISTALLLGGCFMAYLPLLMLAPLQPFIMLAAKLAARYGPLLLLLVETNQQLPGKCPTMIAMQPSSITHQMKLKDIEEQIAYEVENNKNLKEVVLVESRTMTPFWIAEQIHQAYINGCSIRAVFVNSKSYGKNKKLSLHTIEKMKNAGVQLCVTEGLAEKTVGKNVVVQKIPVDSFGSFNNGAAYACIMSTVPATF